MSSPPPFLLAPHRKVERKLRLAFVSSVRLGNKLVNLDIKPCKEEILTKTTITLYIPK